MKMRPYREYQPFADGAKDDVQKAELGLKVSVAFAIVFASMAAVFYLFSDMQTAMPCIGATFLALLGVLSSKQNLDSAKESQEQIMGNIEKWVSEEQTKRVE